jgi:hypothetical protein
MFPVTLMNGVLTTPPLRSVSPVAIWYESASVCALADDERYLGHAVRTEQGWDAFDATHLNPEGTGFGELGSYDDLAGAKAAIEAAVGLHWPRHEALSAAVC